jgi:hypothetical protein
MELTYGRCDGKNKWRNEKKYIYRYVGSSPIPIAVKGWKPYHLRFLFLLFLI